MRERIPRRRRGALRLRAGLPAPALVACVLCLLAAQPAAGAAGLEAAPAAQLALEVRELQREAIEDPEADRERWEAVRARTAVFLRRFPRDRARVEMAFTHGMAAFRLGRMEDAAAELGSFLERHGGAPQALPARYLRGLALAEKGRDAEALAALEEVLQTADLPAGLRVRALYAQAQVHIRRNRVTEAREALEAVVEVDDPGEARLTRRAQADLRCLGRIGQPVPEPVAAAHAGETARVVILVLRRAGQETGEDLRAEAARAAAAAGASVALRDRVVGGFEDPLVQALNAPALPRSYVLVRESEGWVIRAAGLRGAALREAAQAAAPRDG